MVKWFQKQEYGYKLFVISEQKVIMCCSSDRRGLRKMVLGARGGGAWNRPDFLLNPIDHNE